MQTPSSNPKVVAFDGPAASGKGTLVSRLASDTGFAVLDCGLLYRAFAQHGIKTGVSPEDITAVSSMVKETKPATIATYLAQPDVLRTEEVAFFAARLGASVAFNAPLFQYIRETCASPPDGKCGTIVDGRGVGTNIYREAQYKFYITADTATRALRRYNQLCARGENLPSYGAVFGAIAERDQFEMNRPDRCLQPAAEATIIDTTDKTVDQAYAVIFDLTRDIHL